MSKPSRFSIPVIVVPALTPPRLEEPPPSAPTLESLKVGQTIISTPVIEIAKPAVRNGGPDAFLPQDRKLRGMDPTGDFILSLLARIALIDNGPAFAATLHDLVGLNFVGREVSSSPANVQVDKWTTPNGTTVCAFAVTTPKAEVLGLTSGHFLTDDTATEAGGGFDTMGNLTAYLSSAYALASLDTAALSSTANRYVFTGHGLGATCAHYAALRANQVALSGGQGLSGPVFLCVQFGPVAGLIPSSNGPNAFLRNFKNVIVITGDDPAFDAGLLAGVLQYAANHANQDVSVRSIFNVPGATGYEDVLILGPVDDEIENLSLGIVRFVPNEGGFSWKVQVNDSVRSEKVAMLTDPSFNVGLRMAKDGPCNGRGYCVALENYCRDKRLTPYPLFTNLVTASRGLDDLDIMS